MGALAVTEDHKNAADIWSAVSIDELWQEEMWGADADAQKARAFHQAEWNDAAEFLSLLAA